MNKQVMAAMFAILSLVTADVACAADKSAKPAGILAINHLGIASADIEKSLKFYRDLMGMEVQDDARFEGEIYDNLFAVKGARGRVVALKLGQVVLELFDFEQPRTKAEGAVPPVWKRGINHISFQVADVQKEYERLKAAGITFHCPPQHKGGAAATYGRDPDGNIFELLQLPSEPNVP